MKLVKQDAHVDGCAVACFAMVTGKTYEQALAVLHPEGVATEGYGAETNLNDLLIALFAEGYETIVHPRCPIDTLKTALLNVRYRIGKAMFMHLVVWDAETKTILDPYETRDRSEYEDGLCLAFELKGPASTPS